MSDPPVKFGLNQCTVCDLVLDTFFIDCDNETMCRTCYKKHKNITDCSDNEHLDPCVKYAKLEKKDEKICTNTNCAIDLNRKKPYYHPITLLLICKMCYDFHGVFKRNRSAAEISLIGSIGRKKYTRKNSDQNPEAPKRNSVIRFCEKSEHPAPKDIAQTNFSATQYLETLASFCEEISGTIKND
ncbi:hypothetical protein L5515_009692 [Caenorhabditis briggsae]|uniref:Uncharacterized protein n=1 Tax=Caenorhabditis briggsae TaxID=6238 RepID=A0AAE9F9H2_CAEBR|nr:hypothetical protein L5515_009692 [Caenorhabditis briggsae]